MFDIGTKSKYFDSILKEVYKIIEINYNIKDDDIAKLIQIIYKHLDQYNSKTGMIRMGSFFDEKNEHLEIYLSDYVNGRGMKKLFSCNIAIRSIMRDKLIDDILNDDDDDEII